jgi:hypothetical protein
MKAFITPAYTFTPGVSGVGTVDLSGIAAFDVKKLAAVINLDTNTIIYAMAQPSTRYTAVAGTVLTLFADTSAMNASDKLAVIYEDPSGIPVTISGVATAANQAADAILIGAVGEPAPASDTGASGLNGRLQRIAQNITSLLGRFPTTLGQKTAANSFAVVLASDQGALPAPAVPVAATVKQAAVSFGTAAVRLTTDAAAPSSTRRKLQFIIEAPTGDVNYFMGSSSVTSTLGTRGPRLFPGTLYNFDNDAGDYYIISDTAAQTVYILEQE